MFQPWRIKLRAAEKALQAGRLEEARQMLCQGDLPQFLPAKRLLGELANRIVARGQQRSEQGDTLAGWRDLETATSLGAAGDMTLALRQQLAETGLSEVVANLRAGDYQAAHTRLDELTRRRIDHRDLRALRQVTEKLSAAQTRARSGHFDQAADDVRALTLLRTDLEFLPQQADRYQALANRSRELHTQLHAALVAADWTNALSLSEEILSAAPDDQPARDARRRAWAVVGTSLADSAVVPRRRAPQERAHRTAGASAQSTSQDVPMETGPRFLLWVDAVGGYLVCLGNEVVLGQPIAGQSVDIPILGDLSARHAVIRRVGEGYLLEPLRTVRVDGREIHQRTSLLDGQIIELGNAVKLRFRRPHPLSATARLEFVSRHRTQPSADAILLLAESCVLGSSATSHVPCKKWNQEVVLYRRGEQLFCRAPADIEVDGQPCPAGGPLTMSSAVAGDDFALRLESLT
jgi:tetratricopeptide (TPR) repeat protein